MRDANDMIDIAEGKLEQFVRQDRAGIGEPKQRMIGKTHLEPHGFPVEDSFLTERGKGAMAMDNVNGFTNKNAAKQREKAKQGGKCGFRVDHQRRHIVHLEPIGHVAYPFSVSVRMRHDNHLHVRYIPINVKILIKVTFYAPCGRSG